jgi:hypothetical protein
MTTVGLCLADITRCSLFEVKLLDGASKFTCYKSCLFNWVGTAQQSWSFRMISFMHFERSGIRRCRRSESPARQLMMCASYYWYTLHSLIIQRCRCVSGRRWCQIMCMLQDITSWHHRFLDMMHVSRFLNAVSQFWLIWLAMFFFSRLNFVMFDTYGIVFSNSILHYLM